MEKIKKLIRSFIILSMISFIGEIMHTYIDLPIPASVYGVVILFLVLWAKVMPLEWVESGADMLIAIMPLLFVPSVVKLVTLKDLIMDNLLTLLIIIVTSSVVVMVVTGKVSQWMIKRKGDDVC